MLPGCFQASFEESVSVILAAFPTRNEQKKLRCNKNNRGYFSPTLLPDGESVFSLIKVETGFFALSPGNSKPTTVFFDIDPIGDLLPVEVTDSFWQPFFLSCGKHHSLEDRSRMEVSHQRFDQDRF